LEKDYQGEPLAIGFNAQYMLDFLGAAAEGPISLELKDEQSAGQMRPLAEEAYRYRYVIMPYADLKHVFVPNSHSDRGLLLLIEVWEIWSNFSRSDLISVSAKFWQST